ncbi:four-carbon acid sugar kinase family protein [Phaeovulum sp. W22_SRMD_FR3]|uniref:four-carbon acid sugar kinase family protein n=1 Tax=Phaeovulum sp. W22_SRMD_FR3 TaxID=3240274 RepID=UPI003F94F1CF
MAQVVIIADDLTGALDSACAFAVRGLTTRVALSLAEFADAFADRRIDVLAYPTGTREVPAATAARDVSQVVDLMSGYSGILFKKIDSRLKGHIAAELASLRAAFPRPILAAPAIPAQGRIVKGGYLLGAGVSAPIPIAPRLGCDAIIPDTSSDESLDAVLNADLAENLYVGAAGLSAALARRMAPEGRAPEYDLPLPVLMAIGSRDPLTLAQIAAAELPVVAAPDGEVPPLISAARHLVQVVPGAGGGTSAEIGQRFAAGIAREFYRLAPQSLLACGGETALVILRHLGVDALDLVGEVMPGVPVARCPEGGAQAGLTVLAKSGGFGGPDLLKKLLQEFDKYAGIGVTSS